jgi:hypothetical protein
VETSGSFRDWPATCCAIVASLGRPEGNVTGRANVFQAISAEPDALTWHLDDISRPKMNVTEDERRRLALMRVAPRGAIHG